jgi:hypothetical protein
LDGLGGDVCHAQAANEMPVRIGHAGLDQPVEDMGMYQPFLMPALTCDG